jgi:hypothetical protein
MPGQQRGRGDDPMPTQPAGQGGQDRTVRPAQARHGYLTAQHRDLVAQDEDKPASHHTCDEFWHATRLTRVSLSLHSYRKLTSRVRSESGRLQPHTSARKALKSHLCRFP